MSLCVFERSIPGTFFNFSSFASPLHSNSFGSGNLRPVISFRLVGYTENKNGVKGIVFLLQQDFLVLRRTVSNPIPVAGSTKEVFRKCVVASRASFH